METPLSPMAADRPRVMVVGGFGYIGSVLVNQLVSAGYDVVVGDPKVRESSPSAALVDSGQVQHRSVEPILNGSATADDERKLLQGCTAIVNLHYVWPPSRTAYQRAQTVAEAQQLKTQLVTEERELNLEPTLRLFAAAGRAGVQHYIFSSTVQVYSVTTGEAVTEESPTAPVLPYAMVKLETEEQLAAMAKKSGPLLTTLRFSPVYGIGDRPPRAIPSFMMKLWNGESPEVHGAGTALNDYIAVGDVGGAVIAAIEQRHAGLYLIGSGVGTSVLRLIANIEALVGRSVPATFRERPIVSEEASYFCDITKAQRDLDWSPHISLDEGLRREWEWLRPQLEAGTLEFETYD